MFLHPCVPTPLCSYTPILLQTHVNHVPTPSCSYTPMFLHSYLYVGHQSVVCPFFGNNFYNFHRNRSQIPSLPKEVMFSVALVCLSLWATLLLKNVMNRLQWNSMEGFRVVPWRTEAPGDITWNFRHFMPRETTTSTPSFHPSSPCGMHYQNQQCQQPPLMCSSTSWLM